MANMKKPVGKVKKTQAQIDAELAASKKAFEKYKATRPSKAKLAEIYTEQQNRLRRSKTVAPKPATRRPGTAKPAPLGTAPAAPRRGTATPAPLGTPPAKPTGRRPAMPKTTKKAPEKMTPQDAAMKKILEKRYGKIYG
jgi:hypothetical protein